MGTFGRIKHSRTRISAAGRRHMARGGPGKKIAVEVSVLRLPTYHGGTWHYSGRACFRRIGGEKSCGKLTYGRTPQSATAKALKSLSSVVARRGRR